MQVKTLLLSASILLLAPVSGLALEVSAPGHVDRGIASPMDSSGGGDPSPQPASICIDVSTGCTVISATLTSMSCYPTFPPGCCQVKVYDFTCSGGYSGTITHQYWTLFGTCSGNSCN